MVIYVWKYAGGTFTKTAVIDNAVSVIWIRRFSQAGEFELYLQADEQLLTAFQGEIFLTRDDSPTVMHMERLELTTDPESGDYLTISGRSAESLLGQRIIMKQWNFEGNVEDGLRELVSENIVAPTNTARQMDFISLGELHGWSERFTKQITGKNLLEVVSEICEAFSYGFKLTFTTTGFRFDLYKGTNRSYKQTQNSYVVFSPEYENLNNTTFVRDTSTHFNAITVAGEGEGTARKIVTTVNPQENVTGIYRREKWVDARNTSSNDGEISSGEYLAMLYQQASEEYQSSKETKSFEGEVLDPGIFTAGVDYDLGDTVQVANEYGIKGTAVVSELTDVEDGEGFRRFPTLTEWSV